jgi:hypothetical protein
MNDDELAKKIDRARRRREDELLLLLLLLWEDDAAELATALKYGYAVQPILRHTADQAVPIIARSMADAHRDSFGRVALLGGEVSRADAGSTAVLMAMYESHARDAANAMASTLGNAVHDVQAKFPDENPKYLSQSAIDNVGYSRSQAYGLDQGAERAIVHASNVGLFAAARLVNDAEGRGGSQITTRQAVGLRHYSVVDDRTTDICLDRHMLTLPIDHPYWRTNIAPLHPRCRSIVLPVLGTYEADTVLPTVLPMPGWGRMPENFINEILRAA